MFLRPWIKRIHALSRLAPGGTLSLALAIALGFSMSSGPGGRVAWASGSSDSQVTLYRGKPGQQISGLRIFGKPRLSERTKGETIEQYLVISGAYPSTENSLISGRTLLRRNVKGHFKIKLKLNGPKKFVPLTAVAPDGTIQTERIEVLYPGYHPKRVPRWGVSGGIGISYIDYSQTATDDIRSVSLREMGITGRIGYDYHLVPKRWDLGLSMAATALVPFANLNEQYYPQLGEAAPSGSIRFLDLNARVGYTLPWLKGSWALTLMGGLYYTTTFCSVTPNFPFGFSNLMGPQLFPVLRKRLANGDGLSAYLKYSPVSSGGFSVYSLASREMAGGMTYSIRHGSHFIPVSLDILNLKTNLEDTVTDPVTGNTLMQYSLINATSVTLSIGYTL